ncbi:WD repeat-containing protein [Nitzschia inconspicua]|uniref:WD repeat-containing protein n=1 Tax=Nitzschia inconspicua TaxID=303405 RepID=A0A9K3Q2Z3_9STRA|nr:WD repeat-containing protein [Nitzschia inconspicua]
MAHATAVIPAANDAPEGLVLIDTQHEDLVHDAQLDYYGCKLATCSSDRTIKIYDVSESSSELSATLQGHEGPVWQVSWAHPQFGVILASCSFDGGVLIHRESRPRSWEILYAGRQLHESSVNSVAFSPPEFGLMVAAASSDGRVSVLAHQPDNSWSISYIQDNALGVNSVSWVPAGAYHNPEAVAAGTSPDGASDQPRLVTGGCDNAIRFWVQEASSGQWVEDTSCPVSKDLGHTDWVRDVAWAPAIMPNVNMVASCSEDRTVLIWTQRGHGEPWKAMLLHTFDAPVWRVSWSLTGHILAVSSGDSDVALWKKGMDGVWHQMESIQEGGASGQEG